MIQDGKKSSDSNCWKVYDTNITADGIYHSECANERQDVFDSIEMIFGGLVFVGGVVLYLIGWAL